MSREPFDPGFSTLAKMEGLREWEDINDSLTENMPPSKREDSHLDCPHTADKILRAVRGNARLTGAEPKA